MQVDGRDQMQSLWTTNISKGGLFVVTSSPPPLRSRLSVKLETPQGSLLLHAEVVHILDASASAQLGCPEGVGLQFVNLTDEQKAWIQRYIEGLHGPAQESGGAVVGAAEAMADAKAVLAGIESGDLFAALGLQATADEKDIRARLQTLTAHLGTAPGDATPAQAARIASAAKALKRTELLLDAQQRAAYLAARNPAPASSASPPAAKPGAAPSPEAVAAAAARRQAASQAGAHAAQGKLLLEKGKFAEAEVEFSKAVELDPASAEYKTEQAWATFHNPSLAEAQRRPKALEMIKAVTDKYPKYVNAHYKAGMMKHLAGDEKGSMASMKQVLTLDRNHADAVRIIRLIEMRAAKAAEAAAQTAEGQSAASFLSMLRNKGK